MTRRKEPQNKRREREAERERKRSKRMDRQRIGEEPDRQSSERVSDSFTNDL